MNESTKAKLDPSEKRGNSMSEQFYNWLARKYGWSEETFEELDEEFQEVLICEYASIVSSY